MGTKKITIVDDHSDAGREVTSFAKWYAEMQLKEFAKKYPLTGRRASAVHQTVSQTSRNLKNTSRLPDANAGDVPLNVIEPQGFSISRDSGMEEWRVKESDPAKKTRGCPTHLRRHRSSCMMTSPDRESATMIQQRLEVLLFKEKERKAFKGHKEMPKMVMISGTNANCGPTAGYPNPCQRGIRANSTATIGCSNLCGRCFGSTESATLDASEWIPSERLRLWKS